MRAAGRVWADSAAAPASIPAAVIAAPAASEARPIRIGQANTGAAIRSAGYLAAPPVYASHRRTADSRRVLAPENVALQSK